MSNDSKWLCRQQQGFTLIEVMVALFIFLVIALGLARGEITALRAQTDNLLRDQALALAEAELNLRTGQDFNGHDLDEVPWSPNPPESLSMNMRGGAVTFTRSVRITDVTSDLKLIEVVVGWNQLNTLNNQVLQPTNTTHQASLTTIIVRP